MAKNKNRKLSKLRKGSIKILSDVLSAPSRLKQSRRGNKADLARKSVKLTRETKNFPATPDTEFGRKVMTARIISGEAKRAVKKRKSKKK